MDNQNNTLNFIFGAAIGAVAGYYLFKHQDEIVNKIHELEGNLDIDHNALIEKAKSKLDSLTQSVQSTIERYSGSDAKSTMRSPLSWQNSNSSAKRLNRCRHHNSFFILYGRSLKSSPAIPL